MEALLTSSPRIETGHIQFYYSEAWKPPIFRSFSSPRKFYSSSVVQIQIPSSTESISEIRKRQRPINTAKAYVARRTTTMMGVPPVCGLQHSTTAFRKAPSSAPPGVCRRLIGIFLDKTDFSSARRFGNTGS